MSKRTPRSYQSAADRYDAFVCYSRAADTSLAIALRDGLHDFNRPWYRRRALRVFRDDSSLTANPAHWPSIQRALDGSEYLILLASTRAAESKWVERELRYWCEHKDAQRILLVLTDPQPARHSPVDIRWDDEKNDFDWSVTTVLPRCLSGVFTAEPRWIRMTRTPLPLRDPVFENWVADLSAAIHGVAKDEIIGRDVRQRRTWRRIVRTGVSLIVVIAVVAIWQEEVARAARREAENQTRTAVAGRLVVQADALSGTDPRTALRFGLAAHRIQPGPATTASLVRTLTTAPGFRLGEPLSHTGSLDTLAFNDDGGTLAVGSSDKSLTLWDTTDRMHPRQEGRLTDLGDGVRSVAFGRDRHVLAVGAGTSVRLVDVTNRAQPRELSRLPDAVKVVKSVAFAHDRPLLAVGSLDGTTTLWDVADAANPRQVGQPLSHAHALNSVSLSRDGRTLVTGSGDTTLILWDVTNPDQPRRLGEPLRDPAPVMSVALSPDGRTLASVSAVADTATVMVRDITDRERPRPLDQPISHPAGSLRTTAFHPTGRRLAAGGDDNAVAQWDLEHRERPRWLGPQLNGHVNVITSLAFSPDGRTLATSSYDQTVILWDVADGEDKPRRLNLSQTTHTDSARQVAFSLDRHVLATGGADNTMVFWDVSDRDHARPIGEPWRNTGVRVMDLAFSPDHHTLAVSQSLDTVTLLDVSDPTRPRVRAAIPVGGEIRMAGQVAFSPDGRKLAVASFPDVRFWDVSAPASPVPLGRVRGSAPFGPLYSLAFSPDGTFVAAGTHAGTIDLIAVGDATQPRILNEQPLAGHTQPVTAVAFSPDGRLLASGSRDTRIILWDVTNRKAPPRLGQPLTGHGNEVASLAFADPSVLASGSTDNTSVLWYVADPSHPAQLSQLFAGGANPVYSVEFAHDGRILAAGVHDRTPILWDLDSLRGLIKDPTRRACSITAGMDEQTWRFYLPELAYQAIC